MADQPELAVTGLPDGEQSVHDKYLVMRTDGRDGPGNKHHDCRYFVLDLTHDLHARKAAAAYAESIHAENYELACDIRRLVMDNGGTTSDDRPSTEADDA